MVQQSDTQSKVTSNAYSEKGLGLFASKATIQGLLIRCAWIMAMGAMEATAIGKLLLQGHC